MAKIYEAQNRASSAGVHKMPNFQLHKLPAAKIKDEDKLKSVIAAFTLMNSSLVIKFLREHLYLVNLILTARSKIADYFGQSTPLALSLAQYPDEGAEELYLFIQTKLSAKEALPLLELFEENWWLDTLSRARCKMTIKLEYV